jgi:hypothetical protein
MPHSKKSKAQIDAEIRAKRKELRELEAEIAKRRSGATIEDEALSKAIGFGAFAHDIMKGIDLKPVAAKMVLAFIWGYTLMTVNGKVLSALALVTMPAWINFVLAVLVSIAFVYTALATVVPVSNFVYNLGTDIVGFVRREYHAAKQWAADAMHDYRLEHAKDVAERDLAQATAATH